MRTLEQEAYDLKIARLRFCAAVERDLIARVFRLLRIGWVADAWAEKADHNDEWAALLEKWRAP